MSDSFMDAVLNASASQIKPRFKPGKYNAKVTRVDRFKSQKIGGPETFLVELEVVNFTPTHDSGEKDFVPGSPVAQVWTSNNPAAPSNIQDFIVGAYKALAAQKGLDPTEVTADQIDAKRYQAIVGADSVVVKEGTVVGVIAYPKEKVKTPGEFYNRLIWSEPFTD